MAAARPAGPPPGRARQADIERLALELGRILLAAARDHPAAWRAAVAGDDGEGQRRPPGKRRRCEEARPEGA